MVKDSPPSLQLEAQTENSVFCSAIEDSIRIILALMKDSRSNCAFETINGMGYPKNVFKDNLKKPDKKIVEEYKARLKKLDRL